MNSDFGISEHKEERRKFTPATMSDDSRQLVLTVSFIILGTIILSLVLNLVHTAHARRIIMIDGGLIIIGVLFAYRNILLPARIITPTVTFLTMTFFLVDGDGIHDSVMTAYISIILIAGLLLGEIGIIIFGVLTTLSLFLIGYADFFGVAALQTKFSGYYDFIDINTIWFLHLATAMAVYVLVRRFRRMTNEATEREKAISSVNTELSAMRDALQERVAERTSILELQNTALQAAYRVASKVLSATDVNQLLQTSVSLITSEFGYEHAAIFLLNEKRDRATIQAASSDVGKKMVRERHEEFMDETGIIADVVRNKQARIVFNQDHDTVFFNNPALSEMQSEIAIPLISQDNVIGILDIQTKEVHAFTESNLAIFQGLANQIALTLQNTRLIEEARINLEELEAVVTDQNALVWSNHLQKNSYGFVYTPLGIKPLRTARLTDEERLGAQKTEVPIILRGRKIGTISIQRLSRQWTKKETDLLEEVAKQIGLAVENARLLYETREQAQQEQLVSDVSAKLRETLDMDTVLKTAIEEMKRTFNLREVEVRLTPTDIPDPEA